MLTRSRFHFKIPSSRFTRGNIAKRNETEIVRHEESFNQLSYNGKGTEQIVFEHSKEQAVTEKLSFVNTCSAEPRQRRQNMGGGSRPNGRRRRRRRV